MGTVNFPEEHVGQDLVALCVNLSTHAGAAKLFMESNLFGMVVQRIIKCKDALLCKVFRGIVTHKGLAVEEDLCQLVHDELSLESRTQRWMEDFVRLALSAYERSNT